MATSCQWRTKRPLHASDLLVPSMCGGDLGYGEGMARGVMLCATTQNGGSPPGVPGRLRLKILTQETGVPGGQRLGRAL